MGHEFLAGETVLAFDLETTGISTNNDRIVQIALIGSDSVGEAVNYETLINPRRAIPRVQVKFTASLIVMSKGFLTSPSMLTKFMI